MIKVSGISKSLDSSNVLKDINLNIQKGHIFGLIGPNGAGKTTLIKIITGIWKADKGFVKFNNKEVFDNPDVKAKIAYVPDYCHYYDSYKVTDIIHMYSLSYSSFSKEKFNHLNTTFKVDAKKRISNLSKGTKTSLMLMLNLCIMPKYLILDEPFSGLDAVVKRKIVEVLLEEVAENKTTVLLSTHNISDVEHICDSIGIIKSGSIIFESSVDETKKQVRKFQVAFKRGVTKDFLDNTDIMNVEKMGNVHHLVTHNYSKDFEKRLKKIGTEHIEEISLSLEDILIYFLEGGK
ncbi:ABC transporter ATP-binding protein [Herbivorax sp. ANBcel31]|nr:ABC transporter ATP-binding protein [Herbivorax sp. ANBcel31]MDQ2087774.1 ABC transporter ATP-binding protein [Herbivorax sp. ANBcel31]